MDALKEVLLRVKNGEQSFKPRDESPEALRDFQPTAKCLKEAHNLGLIEDLTVPSPSRGIGTYGMSRVAIVRGGLTYRGEQFLASFTVAQPGKARAWLTEHMVQLIISVLATIVAAIILATWGIK